MATEMLNYNLKFDEKNLSLECYFPAVAYDDFDREGCLTPWKICRMFEAGRVIPIFHGKKILKSQGFSYDYNLSHVVLGGDYVFDPCLWEGTQHKYFPFKIRLKLIDVGQTSVIVQQTLINLLDHKEVSSTCQKLVFVDMDSKRPKALPTWFTEKFLRVKSPDHIRILTTVDTVPERAYSMKIKIAASDTDDNKHTNQSSYIRYCLDVAESARRNKLLRHFTTDICLYPISKMSVGYPRETLLGEELNVFIWEDEHHPSILHGVIYHKNTVVFVTSFTFSSNPSSKVKNISLSNNHISSKL